MRPYSCAALEAIAHRATACPQSLALIDPDGVTLNYFELWTQIEALSQRLQEAGVGFGNRIALLLPQGALQVIAVPGVLNRHIAIPLQAKTTVAEVELSLRRLSASALIVSPQYAEETEAAVKMGLAVLVARNGESPQEWEILAAASPSSQSAIPSETILFLITSATTDRSKLVPLTGTNLDAGNATTRDAVQLAPSDRHLQMVSLCHRLGVESAFAQFLAGGTVIATGGFESASYLHWLNQLKPTWYACAPAIHQAALAQLKVEAPRVPHTLRVLQSAGAPLPNDVRDELEQVLGVPVLNGYGATEAHYIAMESLPFRGHTPNVAGQSCGSEIGIMHPSGRLLPVGEEGEIVARGAAVFAGYPDDAEANRNTFHDGWFRTGDSGHLDQDGNLFVTGRLKEMINRGGEKILPGEVESVLASHPAVLEAAAFAVPHPTLGEDVSCAVVLRSPTGTPVSLGELRRFAMEQLPRFKVPNRIYFVDKIPRGELGKPQRWLLAEQLNAQPSLPPSPAEVSAHANDDIFPRLHEIWARILERDNLGFEEDFFAAGGDSLAAINMLAEVDRRLGCSTAASAASFLDTPTLNHLAELVDRAPYPRPKQNEPSEIRIFPVRDEDCERHLFCVPADGEEGLYFRRLATYLRGKMDLSIVRPANAWHSQALFTFERDGKETARLMRERQSTGPYFLGGFCYGALVAMEAARELVRDGQDVRLIFFDAYMPDSPTFLRDWRVWFECARCHWHALGDPKNVNFALDPRFTLQHMAWFAALPFRRFLVPVEQTAVVDWFLRWAQKGFFPLYKTRPIDAPILHFFCSDEPNVVARASRLGWRAVAGRGVTEQILDFDHANILHEQNLPKIVDTLLRWTRTER